MPATALKLELINGVAVPVATLALAAIVIALRLADNAPVLPHEIAAFVFSSHIGGVSPAMAAVIAIVLFLAGVVSGLSGFAFSAVAACILWLLPPLQAVALITLLSVCNQIVCVWPLGSEQEVVGTARQ